MPILSLDVEPAMIHEIEAPPEPPRVAERRGRFRIHPLIYIAGLVVVMPVLILAITLLVHRLRVEPRDGIALATRELEQVVLHPGERVVARVPVARRSGADHLRATRGVLALTDRRLLYVGLAPRDVFAEAREPDVYDRRELRVDTTVSVRAGRAHLLSSRAVVLETDEERLALAVRGGDWPAASSIIRSVAERQAAERAEATRLRLEQIAAEERARAPIWHQVARGEALSTIAGRFGVTVERLRELNGLTDSRIRAGQRLLIKPQE